MSLSHIGCPVGQQRQAPLQTLQQCRGYNTPARAAASSMASGMPSNRRHTAATSCALLDSRTRSGATAFARSTNRRTAGEAVTASSDTRSSGGVASGSTVTRRSARSRKAARLVTSSATRGHAWSNSAQQRCCAERGARSCPARAKPVARAGTGAAGHEHCGRQLRTPSARAIVADTSRASRTAARSTNTTPSA